MSNNLLKARNCNISMTRKSSVLALAIATASLTYTAPVFAQDGVLEEIVVTAQFREQNLQQRPIAITAVNAEMMEARSQNSVFEVSAQAPNVTLKPQGAAYGPSLTASLEVTNLFDEYYLHTIYDATSRAGLAYGTPARPREWALTFKKNF